VKVDRFRLYDIASEDFKISRQLATPACIKRIRAQLIRRTELEIDKKDLNADGMTEVGFYDREASRRTSSRREDLPALPDANSELAYTN
jgi:hypothetical protein